jgi:hypothetical protein
LWIIALVKGESRFPAEPAWQSLRLKPQDSAVVVRLKPHLKEMSARSEAIDSY